MKLRGCLFICLLAIVPVSNLIEAVKKPREKTITVDLAWRRLRVIESRLRKTQDELAETKQRVNQLMLNSGGATSGGGGGGNVYVVGSTRFKEDPECPIGAPGFHYAPQFRSCYLLEPSSTLLNWTEAASTCQEHNPKAHLVSIETEEEMDFLKAKWQVERGIGSISRFWTSGQRVKKKWRWVGSNKPVTYQNWIPTTTHDDERFDCIAVYSNEAYFWGDVACWAPHMVTCEIHV